MQNPPPDQQGYGYGNSYGTPPPNAPLSTPPGSGGPNSKTSTGLDANIAALLAYVLTWVTGLVFYLLEKENRFVRFHAMQAILFGVSITALYIVLAIVTTAIGFVSGILASLVGLIGLLIPLLFLVGWILCMVKAFQGQMFKLPIIGDMAANIVNKN
jgi:uncharacterized membrane protein